MPGTCVLMTDIEMVREGHGLIEWGLGQSRQEESGYGKENREAHDVSASSSIDAIASCPSADAADKLRVKELASA